MIDNKVKKLIESEAVAVATVMPDGKPNIIGVAEYFTQGKWVEMVKKMPENKGMPAKGAILVTVNKIIKAA